MDNSVKAAVRKANAARVAQEAAWQRWQETGSVADRDAWSQKVDAQRAAEGAADRAEVWADRRADGQANWWDAAFSNARAS